MKKSTAARKKSARGTIDAEEVRQFDSLAAEWWDEAGPLKPLHKINPVRLGYLKEHICSHYRHDASGFTPFKGLQMLDIGCGGGLTTEPCSRLGGKVTGIDAASGNIRIARSHARKQKLDIDYQAITAEELAASGKKYDVVTALEIIEHVADPELFIASCCRLVKKNGLIIFSTLNRTPKSFALGIVAAEYILRWVPAGTHNWKKFVKPSEFARHLSAKGFRVTDVSGLVFNPLTVSFGMSDSDTGVNYLLTATNRK